MTKFTIPVSYISHGTIEVEAVDAEAAQFEAEKRLAILHSTGNPTNSYQVNWNDAEATVNHEDINLDDMKYFEEDTE